MKILLLLLLLPTIEIYVLIHIGNHLGAFYTSALVIITGVIGVIFTKKNGKAVLKQLVETTKKNKIPAKEVIEGMMILFGGLCLLLPGVLSDIVGFLLVINYCRSIILNMYGKKIQHSSFFKQLREKLREDMLKKGLIK